MHEPVWIRSYMIVFFVLFGAWLVWKRDCFASAGGYFCSMALDEPARTRLTLAFENRERGEALPSAAMGGILGGLSFALAAVAALTTVRVELLYGALTVALAAILTFGYSRLRRSTRRRVASLAARKCEAVLPWHLRTLVAAAVALPLCWFPSVPVASALVTVAGCAIVLLALRVEALPAQLDGADIAVEAFVDARLRAARVANLFGTAAAPGFVFESLSGYTDSSLHVAALLIALLALCGVTWQQLRLRRSPSPAELATWVHAAF